ncbi:MAG: ATP-binding protein, partial [Bacteroidota bacterium]
MESTTATMLPDDFDQPNGVNLIGQELLDWLCNGLQSHVGVDFVMVGHFQAERERVHIRSMVGPEGKMEGLVYDLEGTPCATVLAQPDVCYFTEGVQGLFPKDFMLSDLGVESYLGCNLQTRAGQSMGILVLMHREPLSEPVIKAWQEIQISERVAHELERMLVEEELANRERLALKEQAILEGMLNDEPLVNTLSAIIQMIEDERPEVMGSVLLYDNDRKVVAHGAAPRLPEGFNRAVHGQPVGPKAGSCGTAIYRNELVVVSDVRESELWDDYRELALSYNLLACWSIPIVGEGQTILGSFAMYLNRPGKPDRKDLELLKRAKSLTGLAIERHARNEQRRQAQEALRELNLELENRVKQRTQALEDAYADLDSFTYTVSHDLRAPLRSISGFLDLLKERLNETVELDEESQNHLKTMTASTLRMKDLIHSILALSRNSSGELMWQPIDLSELATEVVEEWQQMYRGRDFRIDIQPDLSVWGDPRLIRVVLDNLISNAFKYSQPERAIEVSLYAITEGEQPIYVLQDRGIGFDMKEQERLFKPFSRLSSAQKHRGSGIGLATVMRIIRRHRGKVWAESALGEGSRFYFTLPLG